MTKEQKKIAFAAVNYLRYFAVGDLVQLKRIIYEFFPSLNQEQKNSISIKVDKISNIISKKVMSRGFSPSKYIVYFTKLRQKLDFGKITFSENELIALRYALESFSRIAYIQMNSRELLSLLFYENTFNNEEVVIIENAFNGIKDIIKINIEFISSSDVHEDSKIAWDMYQVIRNKLTWDNFPDGGYTVDFDKPMKTSNQQLITIY